MTKSRIAGLTLAVAVGTTVITLSGVMLTERSRATERRHGQERLAEEGATWRAEVDQHVRAGDAALEEFSALKLEWASHVAEVRSDVTHIRSELDDLKIQTRENSRLLTEILRRLPRGNGHDSGR